MKRFGNFRRKVRNFEKEEIAEELGYWTSPDGLVFDKTGIKMPLHYRNGYPSFSVRGISIAVHRFVYYFHNFYYLEKGVVDHINRKREDSRLSNLRWATHSENAKNRSTQDQYKDL